MWHAPNKDIEKGAYSDDPFAMAVKSEHQTEERR